MQFKVKCPYCGDEFLVEQAMPFDSEYEFGCWIMHDPCQKEFALKGKLEITNKQYFTRSERDD